MEKIPGLKFFTEHYLESKGGDKFDPLNTLLSTPLSCRKLKILANNIFPTWQKLIIFKNQVKRILRIKIDK